MITLKEVLGKANLIHDEKNSGWFWGLGWELTRGMRELLGVMLILYILIGVWVTGICLC